MGLEVAAQTESRSEVWYRYDNYTTASADKHGKILSTQVHIHCTDYRVIKTTPKGVWLGDEWLGHVTGPKRFVLRDARKRFACPTKKEALESFLARKKRQRSILSAQISDVADAIALAETELAGCK